MLVEFFLSSSPFSVRQQQGLDSVLYANLQQILINLCSSSNCKSSAAPSVGLCERKVAADSEAVIQVFATHRTFCVSASTALVCC